MDDKAKFDFWYAVNNTEVLLMPSATIETFGATEVHYHLITEPLDSVNQVRVREGRMQAHRPEIITPQTYAQMLLEGFGDEARRYADWLKEHEDDLYILQYGFVIKNREANEHIVSERLEPVAERVKQSVSERNDPLSAVLVGVDQPWEVCLLKLMVDLARQSAPGNVLDVRHRRRQGQQEQENEVHRRIDRAVAAASRDRSRIPELARLLEACDKFKEYEDRFFALVQSSR
jgi:hypothetical protein